MHMIPARAKESLFEENTEKKVCAYCRVSTDDPRQTSSYELQKNHYEEFIKDHPGWVLVDIYADEGITGTMLDKRDEFNRMIADCRRGKIELIVCKSVARFARNVVDSIQTVRILQDMRPPVGVFFETEHMSTLDSTSEMMLALLSMTAQEESHNKSEIMNVSIEQRFKRGVLLTPPLLGYDWDEDHRLTINPEEAATVRLAYAMLLAGFSKKEIAARLNELGRPSKLGNINWSSGSVAGLLRNERYCGDVGDLCILDLGRLNAGILDVRRIDRRVLDVRRANGGSLHLQGANGHGLQMPGANGAHGEFHAFDAAGWQLAR
jgi:DNA invertase Pin-like site-specific DNA recombinase